MNEPTTTDRNAFDRPSSNKFAENPATLYGPSSTPLSREGLSGPRPDSFRSGPERKCGFF